ncbi:O-antigen ligase family protein [Candidatus Gottesmanbacteria bacterium]|nr:O-antigen ligase family protein [Candidatus Gottesmanbacteria bacterium]
MEKLRTNSTETVFWATFVFLLLVWLLNISQYLVVASFILYVGILSLFLKNINLGLILGCITAFCIQTGKTFSFLLLGPGAVSPERFPEGYSITATVSINQIISLILVGIIINGIISKKYSNTKILLLDLLVLGLFFGLWISALFGSNMPEISAIYATLAMSTLIKYIFFRLNSNLISKNKKLILGLVGAILLFEGTVSLVQTMHGSPLAKSIESQKYIEIFGQDATDETNFVFRPLGTFIHANYLGAFIVFTAPIVLALGIWKKRSTYFIIFLLSLIILGLTLSRSAWVALLPQFFLFYSQLIKTRLKTMLEMSMSTKIIISLIVISLFFVLIFPRLIKSLDIDSSDINNGLGIRIAQIENAIQLISLHPLFGVGSGMNVIEGYNIEPDGVMWSFPSSVHNIYILYIVENGIFGGMIYILILTNIIYNLKKSTDLKVGREKIITKGLLFGTVSVIIIGLFQPYNFLEPVLLFSTMYIKS